MNKLLTLLIVLISFSTSHTQGIEFIEATWKEALEIANKEDKILFVDAFTTWCGPCKRMSKYVFTDEAVGSFFNKNFINLKLDMEKPDGVSFGHEYPVSAYPTLYFINGDGKVVKKQVGGQQPEGLINIAKLAIKSNDQSGKYAALYDEGKRDFNTVFKYIKALNSAGKPSLKIANEYVNSKPAISNAELALFLFEATTEADSRIFDLMVDKKELILDQVSATEYREKIVVACKATVDKSVEYDVSSLLEEAIQKCKDALGKESEKENIKFQMAYYADMGDIDSYLKHAEKLEKKYAKKDATIYPYLVKDLITRYKSEVKAMEMAEKFAEKQYKKEKTSENAVLYCNVLIQLKKYDKAYTITEETITIIGEKDKGTAKLKAIQKYLKALIAQQSIN